MCERDGVEKEEPAGFEESSNSCPGGQVEDAGRGLIRVDKGQTKVYGQNSFFRSLLSAVVQEVIAKIETDCSTFSGRQRRRKVTFAPTNH